MRRRLSLVLLAIIVTSAAASWNARRTAAAGPPPLLTVGPAATGPPIRPGFVGVSISFASLESYAGADPSAPNTVLAQLLRNLAPGQRPVVRLGGDSADWTWWPIAGARRPASVKYTLTDTWLAVARALAVALNGRLIVGINLKADNARLAGAEARAVLSGIGARRIEALELGNEPELYRRFSFANGARSGRPGRSPADGFDRYDAEFARVARSLPRVSLAGPSIGSARWIGHLPRFLGTQPEVRLVTLHRYPLKRCSPSAGVSVRELLSDSSTAGLARSTAAAVAAAHARRLPLRIDELNSVSCGGQPGVSDTFASALWILDTLAEMARVGVDGVNVHTQPRSLNALFSFRRVGGTWEGVVEPEYYGLMMFSEAAPPGSRLLRVTGNAGSDIRAWATRSADGRVRVVVINDDRDRARVVTIKVPNATGDGTVERLEAPALSPTDDVTLVGQSYAPFTITGLIAPRRSVVAPGAEAGTYEVQLPPASAALLALQGA